MPPACCDVCHCSLLALVLLWQPYHVIQFHLEEGVLLLGLLFAWPPNRPQPRWRRSSEHTTGVGRGQGGNQKDASTRACLVACVLHYANSVCWEGRADGGKRTSHHCKV